MVTGASTADLAVILVDARKGVLTQTRRHSYLVSLLGIRHVVLAVNKMDLVGLRARALRARSTPTTARSPRSIGLRPTSRAIPVSALRGDNVVDAQRAHAAGTTGRRCSSTSRRVEVDDGVAAAPFRMPVQWVNRPNLDFRGFAGHDRRRRGRARATRVARRCRRAATARVARIVTADGDLDRGRRRPVGHADARRRDRRQPRRRARRAPTRRPRSPTSSRRRSSGWTRSRCCRAAPT